MNLRISEDETPNEYEGHFHRWCLNTGIFEVRVKIMVFNIYLKFRNWCHKYDPIFDSKDKSVFIEFQEKSGKKEIIEKLNEVI